MVLSSVSIAVPALSISSSKLSVADIALKLLKLKPATVKVWPAAKSLVTSMTKVLLESS